MSATVESVGGWSLTLALICMVVFVVVAIANLVTQAHASAATKSLSQSMQSVASNRPLGAGVTPPSITELTELLKALTGTVEAVVKAGPGLAGLVAAMVFMAIASWTLTQAHVRTPQQCAMPKGTEIGIVEGKLASAIQIKCAADSESSK